MKTIKLILLSSLLMVILSGCYDSKPWNRYTLKLRFENSDGNDKVKGLKRNDAAEYGNVFKVHENEYVLQSSLSKPTIYDPLWLEVTAGYECLIIQDGTPGDYTAPSITHTLRCPHIFGDNDKHTIISDWNENGYAPTCSKVTFNGKVFPVSKEDSDYVAHITLDN